MSQNHLPYKIKGTVTLHLTGPLLAELLDQLLKANIQIFNIRWVDKQKLELTISLKDFYAIRQYLRKTNTRMRIIHKGGFPFLLMRMQRRKAFVVGILFFITMIYVLSTLIWKVEVEGNERIPSQQILSFAANLGVYPGQWKPRLPDQEEFQNDLLEYFPQASWVGFRMEGTRAIITVVEKQDIDEKEKEGEKGPVDLVSRRDAVIYDIHVERGRPMVEVNDVVKKGDLLISGAYGGDNEAGEEGKSRIVGAKGKVLGEVWYDSEVVVPLMNKRKVYTGNRSSTILPYVGSWMVRIPFLFSNPYDKYETIQHKKVLYLGKWPLPFGWVEEEYLEMKWAEQRLNQSEAIALGRERARSDLLSQIGPDGKIITEKVLHPRVVSGKVYIRIHFDVVEDIAKIRPHLPQTTPSRNDG